MDQQEVRDRINQFPVWHYEFNLCGVRTPIRDAAGGVNRHEQRRRYFFDQLVALYGGSLKGKRVLDLGCNAGFWSLLAAQAGCDFVLGVDGRQMHVDQAEFVFEYNNIARLIAIPSSAAIYLNSTSRLSVLSTSSSASGFSTTSASLSNSSRC